MAFSSPGSTALRPPPVDDLRRRGIRGGIIQAHRSMVGLAVTRTRIVLATTLALAGTAGMFVALWPIGLLWSRIYLAILPRVGLDATVLTRPLRIPGLRIGIDIPFPTLEAGWPTSTEIVVVAGITAGLALLTLFLSHRFLPLAYFIRALAVVQVVSLGYFSLASPPFPYDLPRYASGLLSAGAIFIASIPAVLGLTFYVIDVAWWRKILLTILLLGHLTILLPLQVLLHVWLIHHGSLLLQPPLFLVFGLLIDILVLVAFYGWGMSWPGTAYREQRT